MAYNDCVDLAVLGSGPGGYTAAFRAADLGLTTALVERRPTLGGVCLNVGCIPSKALLHAARVVEETREMKAHGLDFGEPTIDLDRLRNWKDKVVGQLTGGLAGLAKKRKVEVIEGTGEFLGPNQIRVTGVNDERVLRFAQAIIAVGSEPVRLPGLPEDPRIIDSTGALALVDIPERLLVVGGGIIGLEMATVYQALGSRTTVVEMMAQLMPGTDTDLLRPLQRRLQKQCENLYLDTRVSAITATATGLTVSFDGPKAPPTAEFDRVLLALGRIPNSHGVNAPAAGVKMDEYGFIPVDNQQRTNVPHIFAIGDLVGQPMLAHKASHQGKVAAETAAGLNSVFAARAIPAVAYTDPEIAWCGLTESDARLKGANVELSRFPWSASGRAQALGRTNGISKLVLEAGTGRVLGVGIVGHGAGELIAEGVLAIEMGATAKDLAHTIHPHPTLSETLMEAAEVFFGTATHVHKRSRK